MCTDEGGAYSGHVLHASGGEIALWSSYRNERTISRGDHRSNPAWTMAELNSAVPKHLFG